jgi:biopolymer transport protein ExbB
MNSRMWKSARDSTLALWLLFIPFVALAQEPAPEIPAKAVENASKPEASIGKASVAEIVLDANPMLWPLALCSVVALGFALERFVALRRSRVIPREFSERFIERLADGKLDRDRAMELCRAQESPAARVFGHAVRYWGQPGAVIRQAVEADAAVEVADLKRNIRALSGTATLAPLLGLLGTVFGLIEAFDALGTAVNNGASKSSALAHGISLALVATAIGLVIAAFSVIAYYYLLNRVDLLVRDLDEKVRRVIELISSESAWVNSDRRAGPMPGPADRARHQSQPY